MEETASLDRGPTVLARTIRAARSPRAIRIASVIMVLIVWEIFGRANPLFTSYPTAIASAAVDLLFGEAELIEAFGVTLPGLAAGYLIAASVGVTLGFAMAANRTLDIALDPYVTALYATPRITLIPLLVLWVGIDFKLRLAIVVLSAIFPIIINVRDGAKVVHRVLVDVARCFSASRWQTFRTVTLPGSLPFLFVALRIGAQRAIIGVIVAEMTSAIAGTGRLLLDLAQFFQTDRLFVPILAIGFFSIFVTWALQRLHDTLTPWERLGTGRIG